MKWVSGEAKAQETGANKNDRAGKEIRRAAVVEKEKKSRYLAEDYGDLTLWNNYS